VPERVRQKLLTPFAELSPSRQPDCEVIPTLSFGSIESREARGAAKWSLNEALADLD
jgi:hypothetical protein